METRLLILVNPITLDCIRRGLNFYNAANKPVKEVGKATMLAFKFATWGENPDNSIDNLLYKGRISVACFKCTFYGYIICKQ